MDQGWEDWDVPDQQDGALPVRSVATVRLTSSAAGLVAQTSRIK
jgi:hypothetical protein